MNNPLAYYAKTVSKTTHENEFGRLLDRAIDVAGLKKKKVAAEADIHPTSLSRIISGEMGVARPTAIALVKAINKLSNREVINEADALAKAGFAPDDFKFRRPRNAKEFLEILNEHGLPIPHFATGLKGLENVGEDELNEVLEAMLFQLGQRAKKHEGSGSNGNGAGK